jgi:serine protease Do
MIRVAIYLSALLILTGCKGCSKSGRMQLRSELQKEKQQKPINEIPKNLSADKKVLSLNELYNKYKKSVFLVYTSDGGRDFQGSGFFISNDGLAVSNYHVFEGTSKGLEIIETLEGDQFKIKEVLEKSKENDYIIFRVDIGNYEILNPIPVVSHSPDIGEDVFAIGNPRGLESTLSKGIVSGIRENNKLIQTTAEITYGSSGGPLLNMNGEVIGITTAGLGEANLNFALNISSLKLHRFN